MNNQYETLYEAIEDLKEKGFTHNFEVNDEGLLHEINGGKFSANEVKLLEFHRFEGMSNPADSSILYALQTNSGLKGVIINAYGADQSTTISDFMDQIDPV